MGYVEANVSQVKLDVAKEDHLFSAIFNRSSAFILLVLTSPLFILCAALIRIDSRGSIFFIQERIGLRKQPFRIYKFRTMIPDAEKHTGPTWGQENDPRITKIGRFLRLTRLDEIPQFWNVLKGDMNLVGCRPLRKHFADNLAEVIPGYDRRFGVKPGITGLAQISLQYANTVEDQKAKFAYDLYYVRHHSFLLDIKILCLTLLVPFKKAGL